MRQLLTTTALILTVTSANASSESLSDYGVWTGGVDPLPAQCRFDAISSGSMDFVISENGAAFARTTQSIDVSMYVVGISDIRVTPVQGEKDGVLYPVLFSDVSETVTEGDLSQQPSVYVRGMRYNVEGAQQSLRVNDAQPEIGSIRDHLGYEYDYGRSASGNLLAPEISVAGLVDDFSLASGKYEFKIGGEIYVNYDGPASIEWDGNAMTAETVTPIEGWNTVEAGTSYTMVHNITCVQ
jgi:hypothetical protein